MKSLSLDEFATVRSESPLFTAVARLPSTNDHGRYQNIVDLPPCADLADLNSTRRRKLRREQGPKRRLNSARDWRSYPRKSFGTGAATTSHSYPTPTRSSAIITDAEPTFVLGERII